jgi:signal transduction histidine kinase
MPRVLQSHQLLFALEDFCEMMARGLKTEIEFTSQGELPDMNKQTELNIYRIVQEIVNNAIKYADARFIHVLAKVTKSHFIIDISDDGRGFDLEKVKMSNKKSIGLQNIQSRVELLNGNLTFSTELKKGTSYSIRFQLSKLKS